MSITSKPKPDPNHKKRHAGHHKQSKTYLKTYWPYMPVALIFLMGLVLGYYLPHVAPETSAPIAIQPIGIWETAIGLLALAIFLLRHGFAWRQVWVKGEAFAVKHPLLDIALALIATIGILLGTKGILI